MILGARPRLSQQSTTACHQRPGFELQRLIFVDICSDLHGESWPGGQTPILERTALKTQRAPDPDCPQATPVPDQAVGEVRAIAIWPVMASH